MKRCKVCHQEKDYDDFYFFKDRGYSTTCAACSSKLQCIKQKWKSKSRITDALKTHGNGFNFDHIEKVIESYRPTTKTQNKAV